VLLAKIILLVVSGESQWAVGRQLRMQHQHIGLYFKPPINASVFGVDEKSGYPGSGPPRSGMPLSPGRAERHETASPFALEEAPTSLWSAFDRPKFSFLSC